MSADRIDRIEQGGFVCLLAVVAVVQFSIAAAEIFLGLAILSWVVLLLVRREPVGIPAFGWALIAYAAWTCVSIAFSSDPFASLSDQRELLLLLAVPLAYRLARGSRALTVLDVVVTVGAISAVVDIVGAGSRRLVPPIHRARRARQPGDDRLPRCAPLGPDRVRVLADARRRSRRRFPAAAGGHPAATGP